MRPVDKAAEKGKKADTVEDAETYGEFMFYEGVKFVISEIDDLQRAECRPVMPERLELIEKKGLS